MWEWIPLMSLFNLMSMVCREVMKVWGNRWNVRKLNQVVALIANAATDVICFYGANQHSAGWQADVNQANTFFANQLAGTTQCRNIPSLMATLIQFVRTWTTSSSHRTPLSHRIDQIRLIEQMCQVARGWVINPQKIQTSVILSENSGGTSDMKHSRYPLQSQRQLYHLVTSAIKKEAKCSNHCQVTFKTAGHECGPKPEPFCS